jgi:C-terminal processing protease CtpA/Prc
VDRGGRSIDLPVSLPPRWWLTDLGFRQSTIDPRVYFESEPLAEVEKRGLELKPDGFASRVRYVDNLAGMLKSHELRVGDIVYGVDGVERDEIAHNAELFIKLRKTAGTTVTLSVIRDGKRLQMPLRTLQMSFRK